MKKKILISGINGFLGNRLKELFIEDFQLYGIAKKAYIEDEVAVFSSNDLNKINIEPDYIILCHATISSGTMHQENDLLYAVNIKLTQEIINKFSNAQIIYISTASIYHINGELITEETIDSPINDYSISKYWAEKLVLNTKRASIIRLSSLFGINMKENTIIPNYVNQAINNNRIEVWGKGNRKQNYIFIDDVCLLIKKVITNPKEVLNKVILAVNNREYTNLELAKIIANKTEAVIDFIKNDNSISLNYNNDKTKKLLNWSSNSNFNQEITKYIEWKQKKY